MGMHLSGQTNQFVYRVSIAFRRRGTPAISHAHQWIKGHVLIATESSMYRSFARNPPMEHQQNVPSSCLCLISGGKCKPRPRPIRRRLRALLNLLKNAKGKVGQGRAVRRTDTYVHVLGTQLTLDGQAWPSDGWVIPRPSAAATPAFFLGLCGMSLIGSRPAILPNSAPPSALGPAGRSRDPVGNKELSSSSGSSSSISSSSSSNSVDRQSSSSSSPPYIFPCTPEPSRAGSGSFGSPSHQC
ncbi:hypothetical protein BKA67DRAFT_34916 [Truncatella angustata]|uniref:Uncharacterized protein n=1 Tax=Truncatella angustata TaxID=152316 RepID=A0A9P8UWS8_9PEZI|nr:uncharacterized protein BKA67DRAFT_34916 [Truncatella angustata]KAH6659981.1 hypothetical protein BKA67DRAFT_34916 [Truncatella angustata]